MDLNNRRRRLRGDLARGEDEFEGAYGRSLANQSRWGRTILAFRRVRREAPIVYNLLLIFIIIAAALGADIYFLSNTHKDEVASIENQYKKQLQQLENKYKAEIDNLSLMSSQNKDRFLEDHASHTSDMRKKQKEYLAGLVGDLNDRLKNLVDAADEHWDDHDRFHHGDGERGDGKDLENGDYNNSDLDAKNTLGKLAKAGLDLSSIKNTEDLAKVLGIAEGKAGGRAARGKESGDE